MNTDLYVAKKTLLEGYTLVACKEDIIYKSKLRGVGTLLEYIEKGVRLEGFSCADRVVGKGAAFLYVLLGAHCVYAPVMSISAKTTLYRFGIVALYDNLVDRIINRGGDGFCPVESAVIDIDDVNLAYNAIRNTISELRKKNDL
ncbi:MAG: DUF1893 domain-containing protein [Clostridia bacterium]|nr:DUF1893 domain-containing protein [Clostridia bacterium]